MKLFPQGALQTHEGEELGPGRAGTDTVNYLSQKNSAFGYFELSIPERASKARECFARTIGRVNRSKFFLRNDRIVRLQKHK